MLKLLSTNSKTPHALAICLNCPPPPPTDRLFNSEKIKQISIIAVCENKLPSYSVSPNSLSHLEKHQVYAYAQTLAFLYTSFLWRIKMAFCANCGTKIEEGVKFCSGCGKAVNGVSNEPLTPIFQQPVVLQSKTPMADEVYCQSCGAIIKKEAQMCPKCGVTQSAAPLTTDKKAGKGGIVFLFLAMILSNICFICFPIGRLAYILMNDGFMLICILLGIAGIVFAIVAFIKLRKIFE
jgi:RNA polymerase subunit RPABC4/transcription elongation factor Spt4